MNLLAKLGLALLWASGIFGCLQVHQLDLGLPHGVCGPWGCGPPVEALLGFHGFWFLLFIPAALVLTSILPRRWLGKIGVTLTCIGLTATLSYVIWDGVTYMQAARASVGSYWLQRALFALVTLVDVPMVPAALAGLLLWQGSRNSSSRPSDSGAGERSDAAHGPNQRA